MSEPKPAGDFLRHLTVAEYARISELLDQSIDLIPGDREVWLATLQRSDPKSATLKNGLRRRTSATARSASSLRPACAYNAASIA